MKDYDLVVVGSGPAGEKAAVKAAYFGYRVAVIEKETVLGGAGVNTGTLPSKTLKETALYLSGKYDRGLYGIERTLEKTASAEQFLFRKNLVVGIQGKEVDDNLRRHQVDLFTGVGSFLDDHQIEVKGRSNESISGENILIATGSYPYHPTDIPFDGKAIHDSDTILNITSMPKSICVVGAGVIGCEYATIFATMGCKVYLVNAHDAILQFLDDEISSALIEQMKLDGIEIVFKARPQKVEMREGGENPIVSTELDTGMTIESDMFLYAAGRCGNIAQLECKNAGIRCGPRETIVVDRNFRSNIPHIFAVGDVIGFPALASTSMDQGRVAISRIFDLEDAEHLDEYLPFGIYTVPEVSMVGLTEKNVEAKGIFCCTGRARYSDMPRGRIMGTKHGMLKLVFDRTNNVVLGVHIIGPIAAELIHFGMAVVENKHTLDYLTGSVFNYPTLHDLYKYAAYDGLGNKAGHKIKA